MGQVTVLVTYRVTGRIGQNLAFADAIAFWGDNNANTSLSMGSDVPCYWNAFTLVQPGQF